MPPQAVNPTVKVYTIANQHTDVFSLSGPSEPEPAEGHQQWKCYYTLNDHKIWNEEGQSSKPKAKIAAAEATIEVMEGVIAKLNKAT